MECEATCSSLLSPWTVGTVMASVNDVWKTLARKDCSEEARTHAYSKLTW